MSNGKDAYYFSHDSNARQDVKILKLRIKHGWAGYGLYWGIIEALRDQNGYSFSANEPELISLAIGCTMEDLLPVLETCLEVGLLMEKNGYIYSPSLKRRMEHMDEIRKKRQAAGEKGGKAKQSESKIEANVQANTKQDLSMKGNKRKESKVNKEKEKDLLARFETYWTQEPKKVGKEAARKTWLKKFKKFDEFPWQNVSLHFAIREAEITSRIEEGLRKGETRQEALKWVANPQTWLNATDFSEPPPSELVPEGFEW